MLYPLPELVGEVPIHPKEMMFWQYLPVSVPGSDDIILPDNLKIFEPLFTLAQRDSLFTSSYVYLTAKTLYVHGCSIGNRGGWHIDGFGTEDVNYIWYDRSPTEFITWDEPLSIDCSISLEQMDKIGAIANSITTYPARHVIRLTNRNIHRSPVSFSSGIRSFVKISISEDLYNLEGNSINYLLPSTHWDLLPRHQHRNHPSQRGTSQ